MSTKGSSLPCKKRKTSHDSSSTAAAAAASSLKQTSFLSHASSNGHRKHDKEGGSHSNSSTTDFMAQTSATLRVRKYSQDCSLPIDDLPDCASIFNLKPAAAESSSLEPNAVLAYADAGETSSHDNDTFASSGHRLLMEAIMMKSTAAAAADATAGTGLVRDRFDTIHSFVHQRNRLESWGGMSELSFTGNVGAETFASGAGEDSIPTRILLQQGTTPRGRQDSVTSEANRNSNNSDHGSEDNSSTDMQHNIQAYVAAAMASVGDELRDLAGIIEHVAAEASLEDDFFQINANMNDDGNSVFAYSRPRSQSVSSAGKLSVDLDAVQAAVDAGEAASQTLGLKALPDFPVSSGPAINIHQKKPAYAKRQLPLTRDRTGSQTSNDSKGSIPLKKRAKRPSTEPVASAADAMKTPRISNAAKRKRPTPDTAVSSSTTAAAATTPCTTICARGEERWEIMYEYLLKFAAMKRHEATKDMANTEAKQWVWDGNVQTTHTTSDGVKLGRWVNNQRQAKQKGKLRPDREEKLIAAGLKWFVMPPDAWDDMFEELKLYVAAKSSDTSKWDGNVPTNYQITGRTWKNIGTDKNLGRWVNRQRDMYQSGKLKRTRREKLEQLGLKWPKHAVTWDEMMQLLVEFAELQKKTLGKWDGYVDESYQTNGDPPRLLGKWVSRQKISRVKKKLSKMQEEQLTAVGLRWDENGNSGTVTTTTPQQEVIPMAVASKPDDVDPMQVVSISIEMLGEL